MQWIWNNQKAIRAEKYKGLHGVVMEGDSVNEGVGTHGGSFEEAHFRQSTNPHLSPWLWDPQLNCGWLPCLLSDEQVVIFEVGHAKDDATGLPVTKLMETNKADPLARRSYTLTFHVSSLRTKQRRKRGSTSPYGDAQAVGDRLAYRFSQSPSIRVILPKNVAAQ